MFILCCEVYYVCNSIMSKNYVCTLIKNYFIAKKCHHLSLQ